MTQVIKLKTLYAEDRQAINPLDYLNETFALYSIPAYDTGKPEIVSGKEVGSSKIILREQDVLLSRIVPHIRRCWIVNGTDDHRRIGSGEWIVFRLPKNVDPKYLRYFFLTEKFGKKFLQTVRGVGGSLLRADPKQVGEFEIPLPPLPIQKKIVAILDKADSVRQKDKQLLEHYNKLAQSIFYDMFGDPVRNEKGWEIDELQNVTKEDRIVTYGIVQAGPNIPGGVPYIRTGDIKQGKIIVNRLLRTSPDIAKSYKRSEVNKGDIVMSIRATVGTVALLPDALDGANLTQGTARISPGAKVNRNYLYHFLKTSSIQRWIDKQTKGATFREITLAKLRQLPVALPPLPIQLKFDRLISNVDNQVEALTIISDKSDSLFQNLLQKAFKGELVKEP